MKALKRMMVLATGIMMSIGLFLSCDNDNDYSIVYPNALVTAKTAGDNTFYLQLDEATTLLPDNIKKSPYGGKEVRALVNFSELKGDAAPYDKLVHVNWIDSILTKATVLNRFQANDSVYGNDPVEIVNDWVTIAEDGYLTLRFRTYWGPYLKPHLVNLLINEKGGNPYEVEFRHNAFGDNYGRVADGLVAFSLKDLPDTKGETVKLKLKWKSFSGWKTAEFKYCTRKATEGKLMEDGKRDFVKTLE